MNKKHQVALRPQERKRRLAIISTGRNKAIIIRRAHILLTYDDGYTDAKIAEMLYMSTEPVFGVW